MRKQTLIVACIQLLLVIAAVNSFPIGSDSSDEDLLAAALEAIKGDEQVKNDFCNPTEVDQDGPKSVDTKFDPETGETTHVVDLGVIFHDQAGCNDHVDDDVRAHCEVVIGEDEENPIKSVICNVDEVEGNEGNEGDNSDITTTTVATTTASPPEDETKPNDAQEGEDSKEPIVGGFGDATDLDPHVAEKLVNKAVNAIRRNEGVNIKFCDPAGIDPTKTVSITQQVVAGTNFNIILDLDFHKPTACDYDKKSVRCEVVIFRDLDQKFNVESVDCNDNPSLNDGNENTGTGSSDNTGGNNVGNGSQGSSENSDEHHDQEGNDGKQPNDASESDLTRTAVDGIKNDADTADQFCGSNDLKLDSDIEPSFSSQDDDTTLVNLGVIFHGQTECSEDGEDDVKAQCEVVINADLSIKSVNCQ